MRIVGIIGPYFSGGNRQLIDINIANVQYVMIAMANYFAENQTVGFFAPHSHTARFERLTKTPEPYYHALDETIYDRACEAFVVLPCWESSSGARRDYERAIQQRKSVFELTSYNDNDINTLLKSLEEWAQKLG